MVKLDLKIFGLEVKLDVKYHRSKKSEELSQNAEESKEIFSDMKEEFEELPIHEETHISEQMRIFEQELKNTNIYEIPTYEDIPPKFQINDDVEVITEKFEKEIEDLYEGRR